MVDLMQENTNIKMWVVFFIILVIIIMGILAAVKSFAGV